MELSVLSHDLHALPLGTQLAGAALVLFLSMLALRLFSNACPGKAPPVEEGIPFVGGLIKFSKVRRRLRYLPTRRLAPVASWLPGFAVAQPCQQCTVAAAAEPFATAIARARCLS
jgi:hypothetical protein